jgi:hypothetical protein
MALESDKRTIGNYTYEVGQLGSRQARQTLLRVNRMLGPVLTTLMVGLKPGLTEEGLEAEVKANALDRMGAIAAAIGKNVSEEDLEYLCETFGKVSFVHMDGGKRFQLDLEKQETHFAGNTLNLFKWLAFALQWNYADFLVGFRKPQVVKDS